MSDCSVCLDGEGHYLTPCGHRLHLLCFWNAVKENSKCPICRTYYAPDVDSWTDNWELGSNTHCNPDEFYNLACDTTKTPEERAAKIVQEDRLILVGSRYIEKLPLYQTKDVDVEFATAFVKASTGHRCGDEMRGQFLSWLVHQGLYDQLSGLTPTSNRVKNAFSDDSLELCSFAVSEFGALQRNKGWNIGLCQNIGSGGPRNLYELLSYVPFPSAKVLVHTYLGKRYKAPLPRQATYFDIWRAAEQIMAQMKEDGYWWSCPTIELVRPLDGRQSAEETAVVEFWFGT